MTARRLRAVTQAPTHKPVTAVRAAAIYPQSERLAEQWLAAVRWMQARPQGSVWLLDNRAPTKWRALPEEATA